MRIGVMVSAVLLVMAATGVQAQQSAPPSNNSSLEEKLRAPAVAPEAAPRLTATEQAKLTAEGKTPNAPAVAARGQSVAYMVAGGALFVAGAIIGGDAGTLMMVGGAVIGAYGLFLHFR